MGTIGRLFLEQTTFPSLAPSDQAKGRPRPPLQLLAAGAGPFLTLPSPKEARRLGLSLAEAIASRVSVRTYSPHPLALAELAWLLWCTQGVKEVIPGQATLRTVPSAGARHALETYLAVNRVAGLDKGLYRYLAIEHCLLPLEGPSPLAVRLQEACLGQEMVAEAAATFIWAAVPYRMTWRYGERGFRYLLLEAGHVCQNLYLAAADIGCGACAIGAFDDEALHRLLGLEGDEQWVLYLAAVGRLP